MAFAKLTHAQATFLQTIRAQAEAGNITANQRSELKKELFAGIKQRMGIPDNLKLSVEIDDATSPDYLVLKAKLDNGKSPIHLGDDGLYRMASLAHNFFKVDIGTAVQYYVDNHPTPERVNIDPDDYDITDIDGNWLQDANDPHIVYVPIN